MKYDVKLAYIANDIAEARRMLSFGDYCSPDEVAARLTTALEKLSQYAVMVETEAAEVNTPTLKRMVMRSGMRVEIVGDPHLQNGECIIRNGEHSALVRFQDGLVYIVTGLPPKEVKR